MNVIVLVSAVGPQCSLVLAVQALAIARRTYNVSACGCSSVESGIENSLKDLAAALQRDAKAPSVAANFCNKICHFRTSLQTQLLLGSLRKIDVWRLVTSETSALSMREAPAPCG
jgi:hypothetical protein